MYLKLDLFLWCDWILKKIFKEIDQFSYLQTGRFVLFLCISYLRVSIVGIETIIPTDMLHSYHRVMKSPHKCSNSCSSYHFFSNNGIDIDGLSN